jgi:hypothetical protein
VVQLIEKKLERSSGVKGFEEVFARTSGVLESIFRNG